VSGGAEGWRARRQIEADRFMSCCAALFPDGRCDEAAFSLLQPAATSRRSPARCLAARRPRSGVSRQRMPCAGARLHASPRSGRCSACRYICVTRCFVDDGAIDGSNSARRAAYTHVVRQQRRRRSDRRRAGIRQRDVGARRSVAGRGRRLPFSRVQDNRPRL